MVSDTHAPLGEGGAVLLLFGNLKYVTLKGIYLLIYKFTYEQKNIDRGGCGSGGFGGA